MVEILTRAAGRMRASEAPRLLLVGIDHHCAPIELREKVAYGANDGEALLLELASTDEIAEACLLSTCNRTELYLRPAREPDAYRTGLERGFLRRAPEVEKEGRLYVKRDQEAVRHLLQVACGLESMVLGEPEILGQVKQAAALAATAGTSGTVLQRLLRVAIETGGRVRHETGIAAGSVSFGYAIVDLAHSIFQHLEDCSVLLVGAGETARQVARNLIEHGARELRVTNRSVERAEAFQKLFPQCERVPFAEREAALTTADIVVASTGAEEPVLTHSALAAATKKRRARPLLVVDLGVPRNVEPRAGSLENVFLQDVDSLEKLIERNLKRRREEIPRVQQLVDHELERFIAWSRGLAAEPLVAELQKQAERIRVEALHRVRDRFPVDTHEELERLTRTLVRRLLHHPSTNLRRPIQGDDLMHLDLARRLFRLEDEPDDGDERDG